MLCRHTGACSPFLRTFFLLLGFVVEAASPTPRSPCSLQDPLCSLKQVPTSHSYAGVKTIKRQQEGRRPPGQPASPSLTPPILLEGACVWAAGLLLTSGRGGCVQTGTPPPCRAGPRTKFRNLVNVPQRHPAPTCAALKPQEGPNMSRPEAGRVPG